MSFKTMDIRTISDDFFTIGKIAILQRKTGNDVSLEEMWDVANNLKGTQELVDAFAGAFNKFWWVEDDVYDYEEGTEEYEIVEAQLSGILEEVLL